ncbi:serine hydrolase [Rhizoctonia solani 123E]|uniref:Serine hydrolase n=1 Tax=Rhizoctonia solani 123E TaxID=1423351 RepID=A0A074RV51_9AGAM|nr:serine hydrolase [Rhizoctonia solani 123E]
MIRILALHGYAQSGEIFKKKMGVLRKACGKNIEFVFLDAPILLQPADMPQAFASVEALDTVKAPPEEPELQPRAWWRASQDKSVYYHVPETIEYLKNYLKDQRFHGVFGFSQGACMAAALTKILEQPEAYPAILVDDKAPHPPFEFCVLVSGFKPVDNNLGPLFFTPITTPNLHVLGRNDAIVIPERGKTLVDVCKDPRVEEHEGGHFVPSKANWRNFFKDYLLSFDPALGGKPVPSPGPAGDTPSQTPGSGTPAEISRVGTPSKT